ncbi:hypothetical protein PtA15_17A73 [Puccinia triticina]|uniref:Uncharacterized protein n=1 Tax=Puccinia triticina TaxID=208348 RepID=A0ABY7DCC1_9BASI|nr:uncharacterized protein PtA15_17A73 [Puccinia triticina]WAQ92592.1 hypothetical protein PtA15_17A73 [Puccinia triticina]
MSSSLCTHLTGTLNLPAHPHVPPYEARAPSAGLEKGRPAYELQQRKFLQALPPPQIAPSGPQTFALQPPPPAASRPARKPRWRQASSAWWRSFLGPSCSMSSSLGTSGIAGPCSDPNAFCTMGFST